MNRITLILKSTRTWGLIGTAVVLYFFAFIVFGKLDMSWIMPDTNQLARAVIDVWPRLPIFEVEKEPAANGKGEVIYYTVPTRQFTQQELKQMGSTNANVRPAISR